MKVTVELLKKLSVWGRAIEYFESLGRESWDLVSLIKRVNSENKGFRNFLCELITTTEELENIYNHCIQAKATLPLPLHCIHKDVLVKDKNLFKKIVLTMLKKDLIFDVYKILIKCNSVFMEDSDFTKECVKAVQHNKKSLEDFLIELPNVFRNDPSFVKECVKYHIQIKARLKECFIQYKEIFLQDPQLYMEVNEYILSYN
jgi:hypothetical protein